jgi:hypothetical protein
MIQFKPEDHLFFFLIAILGWPIYVFWENWLMLALVLIANALLFMGVAVFIASEDLDPWDGLVVLTASFMSGCANITIIYIIPVLTIVYLIAILKTVIGLFKGRAYTQEWWIRLVSNRARIMSDEPLRLSNADYQLLDSRLRQMEREDPELAKETIAELMRLKVKSEKKWLKKVNELINRGK